MNWQLIAVMIGAAFGVMITVAAFIAGSMDYYAAAISDAAVLDGVEEQQNDLHN